MSNYNWLFDLPLDTALMNANTMGNRPQDFWSSSLNPPLQNTGRPISATQHATSNQENSASHDVSASLAFGHSYPTQPGARRKSQKEDCLPRQQVKNASQLCANVTNDISNDPYWDEAPMALIDPDPLLPQIDDLTYDRLLELVEISRPVMPDGSLVALEHALLSLSSLQSYLDLFFTRFNVSYPLIHMATFEPAEVDSLLLISMVLLGATYSEKDAHQVAVCIHDVLRPQIFSNPSFSAKPELWMLQTILLTECFGKSRGGQKQHDMSHLFHGLLINLIRRSDCQTVNLEAEKGVSNHTDNDWRHWAEQEQKKRLAQLCFVWDVQHAVLFSQSLCMSAFELRSTLPCHQRIWEASSVEKWQDLMKSQKLPVPHLLSALKLYLKSDPSARTLQLSALARMIVFHGLMSISWDMTRRDQTSLGMMGNGIVSGSWREKVSKAYDGWKADFDTYVESRQRATQTRSITDAFHDYSVANSTIYHAAKIILNAEILDLQIYAGARHILGRPVSRVDYTRSQKNVKHWANIDASSAALATWHAAHILSDALTLSSKSKSFVVGDLFHHPWTLFLANVTIWSFFHARPASSSEGEDEIIWSPKSDMSKFLETLIQHTPQELSGSNAFSKTCTASLTSIVVNNIGKIRWGVVHDGMLVLKGLVPWRLINEDVE